MIGMGWERGVTGGILLSNGDTIFDLSGWAACASVGLGPVGGAGCLWQGEDKTYWSAFFGYSSGFLSFKYGGSASAVRTGVHHIRGFWAGLQNRLARFM